MNKAQIEQLKSTLAKVDKFWERFNSEDYELQYDDGRVSGKKPYTEVSEIGLYSYQSDRPSLRFSILYSQNMNMMRWLPNVGFDNMLIRHDWNGALYNLQTQLGIKVDGLLFGKFTSGFGGSVPNFEVLPVNQAKHMTIRVDHKNGDIFFKNDLITDMRKANGLTEVCERIANTDITNIWEEYIILPVSIIPKQLVGLYAKITGTTNNQTISRKNRIRRQNRRAS